MFQKSNLILESCLHEGRSITTTMAAEMHLKNPFPIPKPLNTSEGAVASVNGYYYASDE